MGLTGDFAGLADLAGRLASLPGVLRTIPPEWGDRAVAELKDGFISKRDPYGRPWRPQKRHYGNPLMRRSGALMGSISGNANGVSFTVKYGTPYGGYHQGGTRRMVARQIIPDRDIPDKWRVWLREIAAKKLSEHLG